jgi:hypothetical protein
MIANRKRKAFGIAAIVFIPIILIYSNIGLRINETPPPNNSFLNDLAEPITIDTGLSLDDGGSLVLQFSDLNGKTRTMMLENTIEWSDEPSRKNLILGKMNPSESDWVVPITGREEKQVLGILKRWAEKDPVAQAVEKDYRIHMGSPNLALILAKHRDPNHEKFIAWCLMDRLRNPKRKPESDLLRWIDRKTRRLRNLVFP